MGVFFHWVWVRKRHVVYIRVNVFVAAPGNEYNASMISDTLPSEYHTCPNSLSNDMSCKYYDSPV